MLNLRQIFDEIGEDKSISIYTNSSTEFMFGRILAYDELFAAVYTISSTGFFEGITVIPIRDISKIEFGGQSAKNIYEIISESEYQRFKHSFIDHDIRRLLLEASMSYRILLSIRFLQSGSDNITGVVENISDNFVEMYVNYDNDFYSHKECYSIDDITWISCKVEKDNVFCNCFLGGLFEHTTHFTQ